MGMFDGGARKLRIALYSHDTMGLGHTRRNLLIARTLAAAPLNACVLVVSGIREAGAFLAPTGVDFLTLPAFFKDSDGDYQSRALAISATELASLRSEAIKAALVRFKPDLFIVDNVPRGALNELVPTLEYFARHKDVRCVLGLRDVIDEPSVVKTQWLKRKNFDAIRDYYDAVWIYGDPAVYDAATEYEFPYELLAKTKFTGYLNPRAPSQAPGARGPARQPAPRQGRYSLCVVGGGQDGARLARTFAAAKRPRNTHAIIVTGPFMPESERRWLARRAAPDTGLTVVGFVSDPIPLMTKAQSIVSMGGYNTVSEILSLEKRALIVPRSTPRMEQLIRAERLNAMGLIDFIRDDELTEAGVSDWLNTSISSGRSREAIDFDGLDRIPRLVTELLSSDLDSTPHSRPPIKYQAFSHASA